MHSSLSLVSIVIPVFNKLSFTRQCLDRLGRDVSPEARFEVIVVDNGSSDETGAISPTALSTRFPADTSGTTRISAFHGPTTSARRVRRPATCCFSTTTRSSRPGWLEGDGARWPSRTRASAWSASSSSFRTPTRSTTPASSSRPAGEPQHIYPHADASLPHVNKQREYQAVDGVVPADLARTVRRVRPVRRGLSQRLRRHRPLPEGPQRRPVGRLLHEPLHLPLRPDHRDADRR